MISWTVQYDKSPTYALLLFFLMSPTTVALPVHVVQPAVVRYFYSVIRPAKVSKLRNQFNSEVIILLWSLQPSFVISS
jgi:hypothetical protein